MFCFVLFFNANDVGLLLFLSLKSSIKETGGTECNCERISVKRSYTVCYITRQSYWIKEIRKLNLCILFIKIFTST